MPIQNAQRAARSASSSSSRRWCARSMRLHVGVVAAEHVGRRREPLEIVRRERRSAASASASASCASTQARRA